MSKTKDIGRKEIMTSFEFYCVVGFFGLIMGLAVVAWLR